MKIAVITDNSQTISAHFGKAQYYDVFTIEEGQVVGRETRPKANHSHFGGESHHENHGVHHRTDPGSEQRHNAMLESIRDCHIVLAGGMGMGAFNKLTSSGIRPIITDIVEIERAVNAYLVGSLIDHPERLH